MKKIKKRVIPLFMAVLMLFGLIPTTAFAADVTMDLSKCEVSWDYILTDEDGNPFTAAYGLRAEDNPFGYAITPMKRKMHDYTAKRPGLGSDKSEWIYGQDYVYCFCIEHGIPLPDDTSYAGSSNATHGNKYEKLSAEQKDLLALALTYGYPNRTDLETSKDANACYSATQLIAWQITLGWRTSPTSLNDKSYPVSGYSGTATEQYCRNKYFKEFYDRILKDMADHYKRPSFTSTLQSSAPTYEMNFEGGKYTVTLTDTNNVLQKFYVSVNGGVSTSISGNKLTLSSSKPISDNVMIKLNRRIPSTNHTTGFLIWSVPGKENANQDMVSGVPANNDPVPAYLRVEAPAGSVKIVKTSEDGKVSNISFTVTGNGVNQTVHTNAAGEIQISNLKPGIYTVTEQNYDKYEPQESRQVTVVSGQTATVTFNNKLRRGDLTVTKAAEDGLSQGMKFHLYGTSLSGLTVNEYAIVGVDGKAYFQGVLIGKGYTLEEIDTPDRYIVPEKQTADIEWNKVTGKSFNNELKRGDMIVTKTAEDGLTEGLRFHLYGTSYSGITVDEYAAVESDGKAYFEDILMGTDYVVEEIDSPYRYVVPADQTATIEWDKVTEKSFDNRLKKWNLTVKKSDSETGSAQGDASLAGAVYGIYKGKKLIDRYTTDASGRFTTSYYLCGDDWSLREITPSKGYLVDASSYHIGAEAKNYTIEYNSLSSAVTEDIIKGNIAIIKHTDDGSTQLETPEVGAEFEVFLKKSGSYANAKESERSTLICDEHGFAQTKDLPYGVYTVHQTKGWEGRELLPDFDVFVSEDNQTYRYLINNSNFESYIKIIKTDAESGLSIPYAGAGFEIHHPDGTKVVMQTTYPELQDISTFYTNSEGYLITPQTLDYGKGYYLVEVQAPYGYILNSEPLYFDITENNSTEEGGVTVVSVTRSNLPQKGVIHIEKNGEVFQSVIESNGMYKPVYEIKGLAGATFEVRAAENVYTLDGVLHYAKGELVDTITTEADGIATSKALYLGKYDVQEVTAPYGMVLNSQIQTVELVYAGQEVSITETSGNLYNERQKVKVSLSKVLEQNELFGIGMNGELASITFGLYTETDLVAADGTMIPAGGLLEIISFDETGLAVCSTDLPFGSFYLQERSTDDHYILSNAKYGFVFDYTTQDTAVVELTVNNGAAIENNLKYGSVSGLKLDEDGKTIAGAVFGLFRNDENEYSRENALLIAESTQDGTFRFDAVPYGTWVVREIEPAVGFVLNEKAYQVKITEDGQVVEIQLENRYIRGDIEGLKVDEDGNTIAGAVFGLFRIDASEFTEDTAVLVTETDAEGKFRFEDIRFGKWIVRELKPATGFVLNETPVEVNVTTEGEIIRISFENKFIQGDIKGYKVDEDGEPVGGAIFGLFKENETEFKVENAVLTAESDAEGVFLFEDIRFGKWIVKELQPATGFVANDTLFPVDISVDGDVIEIEAVNRHIYGMVHTTKVDQEYPDHLLSGAIFEVYQDENDNKKFDDGIDILVAELVEYEPGLYELENLRYGGYFLYEKQAPDNFLKDNGYYYFEIVNDGEMVEVENEAGIGFINNPMRGNLKIVKTSSDGRVEGFSFRVTGENYDEVFKTDSNGEIVIENLRIGKYTVTELEDEVSAGYDRPAPVEVELVHDETLTVNVYNDKITVDIPQTGDSSNLMLWFGLMLLSAGAILGIALYSRKKKYLAN